jgi:hypothetical protein
MFCVCHNGLERMFDALMRYCLWQREKVHISADMRTEGLWAMAWIKPDVQRKVGAMWQLPFMAHMSALKYGYSGVIGTIHY